MVVTCGKCSRTLEVPDAQVPLSGAVVRCPGCQQALIVKRGAAGGAAAADTDEYGVALRRASSDSDEFSLVPRAAAAPSLDGGTRDLGQALGVYDDLPAPVARDTLAGAAAVDVEVEVSDLPVPRDGTTSSPPGGLDVDLPAPKRTSSPGAIVPVDETAVDLVPKLPGLMSSSGPVDVRATALGDADGGALFAPTVADLPAPVALPTPIGLPGATGLPVRQTTSSTLPMARGEEVPALPGGTAPALPGAPTSQPSQALPGGTDNLALPGGVEPSTIARAPGVPSRSLPSRRRQKSRRLVFIVAGSLAVAVAGGAALLGFTDVGLHRTARVPVAPTLAEARRDLARDGVRAFRQATTVLTPLVEQDPRLVEARALRAQAHLLVVLRGFTGELKDAEADLDELAGNEDAETRKARALRDIVAGRSTEAESLLGAALSTKHDDAFALAYRGLLHMRTGDTAAAHDDYAKAAQLDPSYAGAWYGRGRTEEELGDAAAARADYQQALERNPEHIGSILGLARLTVDDPAVAVEKLEAAMKRHSTSLSPILLAEAWSFVGARVLDQGSAAQAEAWFRKALAADPTVVDGKVGLGRALTALGAPRDAVPLLESATQARPRDRGALFALLDAQLGVGDIAAAEATLVKASQIGDPNDAQMQLWTAKLEVQRNRGDDAARARKTLEGLVASAPTSVPASLALAALDRREERAADADAALRALSHAVAKLPLAEDALGREYLALGRLADAEAEFARAASATPAPPLAAVHRATALLKMNRLGDAEAALAGVVDAHPDLPGLAALRAELAAKRGRLEEAATRYDEALAGPHPDEPLRLAAADVDMRLGRLDAARKLFDAVLHDDERNGTAQLGLAEIDLAQGNTDEASVEAQHAVMLTDSPRAHLVSAQASERLGRVDAALADYQAAATGDTRDAALLGRARVLVSRGAVRDAQTLLDEVLRHEPGNAEAHLLVGDCLEELGDHDRARAEYATAASRDAKSALAAFKYGRALKDAGSPGKAAAELERAVALGGDKASFAAEAYLLAGDARRQAGENGAAVRDYKKYLEVAPPDAEARADVGRALASLRAD